MSSIFLANNFLTNNFTTLIDPYDMKDDYYVDLFIKLLKNKYLESWVFGKRGDYISSNFITKDGTEDQLTSSNKNDNNYSDLLKAHYCRAIEHINR